MMTRAIVHIGLENTGTTYLQKSLSANRSVLRQAGFLYPATKDVESHLELAAYAMDDDKQDTIRAMVGLNSPEQTSEYRKAYEANIAAECSSSDCHTVIFSSEHLSSRLIERAEIERLRDLLRTIANDIQVVAYLRRQDEAWLSTYATSIRGGDTDELAMPKPRDFEYRLNYAKILDRWAEVFGQEAIVVRRYGFLVDNDILSDFKEVIGLSGDLATPSQPENYRLDAKRIEFLRLLNYHLPAIENGSLSRRRANISAKVEQMRFQDGPPLMLPPAVYDRLMPSLKEDNRYVAEKYVGHVEQEGDPLFGDRSSVKSGPTFEIKLRDFAEMTAALWSEKQKDSRSLWEHVQMLQNELEALKTEA